MSTTVITRFEKCFTRVFLAVSHVEENRLNGIAPSAYAIRIITPTSDLKLIGWGGERSGDSMFLHAIIRASDEIILEIDDPSVDFIAKKIGFASRISEANLWDRKEYEGHVVSKKDNRTLKEMARAYFSYIESQLRKPTKDEATIINELQAEAKSAAELANRNAPYRESGIVGSK